MDAGELAIDAFVPAVDAFVSRDAAPSTDAVTLHDAAPADAFVARDSGPPCTPLPTTSTSIAGTISPGPTIHRPTTSCGAPSTVVGLAVSYDTRVFCNPGGARAYDFGLASRGTAGILDPFVIVYSGMGDVSTLTCLTSDDDGATTASDSLATATIPAGATITVVATTYDDDDTGDYTLTITAR